MPLSWESIPCCNAGLIPYCNPAHLARSVWRLDSTNFRHAFVRRISGLGTK